MYSHTLLIFLVIAQTNIVHSAQDTMGKEIVNIIPDSLQIVGTESLAAFPDLEHKKEFFIWPNTTTLTTSIRESDMTLEQAKEELVNPNWITTEKTSVTQAKRVAEKWMKTVLLDKWIPINIEKMLIALDSDVDGYDTIRIRYEIEGLYIQISQTNQEIGIAISGKNIRDLTLEQVMDLFFRDAEKIKECIKIQDVQGGKRGVPTFSTDSRNQYWGNTRWWVAGECHMFLIMKFYGGAGRPMGLPKDWF